MHWQGVDFSVPTVPRYIIWHLLLKDRNTSGNLKHHYLKLKSPFLNGCKSDPSLQSFLKASTGLEVPCPESFLCSFIKRHRPLGYLGTCVDSVKGASSPDPSTTQKESSKRGKCTMLSVLSITYDFHVAGTMQHLAASGGIHAGLLGSRAVWGACTISLWGTPLLLHAQSHPKTRVTNSGDAGLEFLIAWRKSQLVEFLSREKKTNASLHVWRYSREVLLI